MACENLSLTQKKKAFLCDRSVFPSLGFFEQGNISKRKLKFQVFYRSQMQIFPITHWFNVRWNCYKTSPGKTSLPWPSANHGRAEEQQQRAQRGVWKLNIFQCLLKWLKQETTESRVYFSFSPTVSVTCCSTAPGNSLPLCVQRSIWK